MLYPLRCERKACAVRSSLDFQIWLHCLIATAPLQNQATTDWHRSNGDLYCCNLPERCVCLCGCVFVSVCVCVCVCLCVCVFVCVWQGECWFGLIHGGLILSTLWADTALDKGHSLWPHNADPLGHLSIMHYRAISYSAVYTESTSHCSILVQGWLPYWWLSRTFRDFSVQNVMIF